METDASQAGEGSLAQARTPLRLLMTMAGRAEGGAETFFCRLASALARRDVAVSTVVRPHPNLLARLSGAGIESETAPFRRRFDRRTGQAMRTVFAAQRPQIALAFMQRAAALTPKGRHLLIGRLGGPYPLKRFRNCDHLIAPSPHLVEHIAAAGWPREKVSLVANFLADRAEERRLPPGLPRPERGPLLLGLGRLHQVKGFEVLLQALTKVPRATLWLSGSGPEEVALRHQAGALGLTARVRFLGWQDDPLPLLRAADLLVVPSLEEPFGNVVLEAWMAGCPLLASDADGPAWLIEDRVSGRLFPRGEPDALAGAIAAMTGDPEGLRRLAAGGRAAYLKGFTEERGAAAYLALFATLLAKQGEKP